MLLSAAQICFDLRTVDDGLSLIKESSKYSAGFDIAEDQLGQILSGLTHPLLMEIHESQTSIHVELVPQYYRVNMIMKGQVKELISIGQIKALGTVLTEAAAVQDRLFFNAKYGKIQEVYKAWCTLPQVQQTIANFLRCVVGPVITNNNWLLLWRHAPKKFAIAKEMSEFLRQRQMKRALLTMLVQLEKREDAILVGAEIGDTVTSWRDWSSALIEVQDAIRKESEARKKK